MPVTLTEDSLDLTLEGVEFVPFRLDGPPSPCHPLPQLARGGQSSPRGLRSVAMENDLLAVTIIPDLGGRIMRLLDKRTGRDLLPWPSRLQLAQGSPRGLWLKEGIRFLVGEEGSPARSLDLAPIEYQLREPQSEDEPGLVHFFELLPGGAASWQGGVTLYPDRAELLIEFTLFNRSREPLDLDTGLALGIEGGIWERAEGAWGWCGGHGEALWVKPEPGLGTAEVGAAGLVLKPRAAEKPILPREVFSWSIRLAPYTGLGAVKDVCQEGAWGEKDGRLLLQVGADHPKAVLRLESSEGAFSAQADLSPLTPFAAELSSLPKVQTLMFGVDSALKWGASDTRAFGLGQPASSAWRRCSWQEGSDEFTFTVEWLSEEPAPQHPSNPALTSAWRVARSEGFCRQEEWKDADREADLALILNGEDSLAWWLKSVIRRKLGEAERPELLNAHYLSPLEPLLRAESFLQQGGASTKEGSPMTLRLAKNPDLGLDCLDQILSLGLTMEAGMLMDELLRHEEIGLVRLMLAWSLLTKSRMEAEAAQHLARFEKSPVTPPLPSRPREIQAVTELHERFPRLERLKEMARLAHPRSKA